MIAIDASVLLLVLSQTASPPLDVATGKPVTDARARVDHLIERCQKGRVKIVIPTPVLSEVLVRAGNARNEYLRIIQQSAHFKVMPFDARAAVDVADMTRAALDSGDKKGGSNDVWAKVKFDRQIVAIAKNQQVTEIYSDDADIRNIAARFDIPVIGLAEMPMPPESLQTTLVFDVPPGSKQAADGNAEAAPTDNVCSAEITVISAVTEEAIQDVSSGDEDDAKLADLGNESTSEDKDAAIDPA